MSYTITTWTDELGPTEVEVVIEYDFTDAEPEVNFPETLDFCGAWPLTDNTASPILDQDEIERWASSWLHGRGRDKAVANAVRSKP
jgi:hypothetical protein